MDLIQALIAVSLGALVGAAGVGYMWYAAAKSRRKQKVYVIFDGAPTEPAPRFVEVEDEWGRSVGGRKITWQQQIGTADLWQLGPFELPKGE